MDYIEKEGEKKLAQYIIRRILYMIPTIIVISIISFVVIQLPPGDFLTSYIASMEASGVKVSNERIQSLERRYGINKPFSYKYFKWVGGMFKGDFGMSWNWDKPVINLVMERLPLTIVLSLATLLFTYLVAIPVGIISAVKQYTVIDYISTTFGFIGLAIPNFLLALVIMFVFYEYFDVTIGGLFANQFKDAPWSWAKVKDLIMHLWIPIIVVGTAGTARLIRIMRGVLLDELGKDYMNTARAKGLKEITVIIKHAVRIALNPIISVIGWQLPRIISGAAITSIVLGLPTTGPLLIQALRTQDMYLAGSFIFWLSILTVIGTFVSDLLLCWIDPRVQYN